MQVLQDNLLPCNFKSVLSILTPLLTTASHIQTGASVDRYMQDMTKQSQATFSCSIQTACYFHLLANMVIFILSYFGWLHVHISTAPLQHSSSEHVGYDACMQDMTKPSQATFSYCILMACYFYLLANMVIFYLF